MGIAMSDEYDFAIDTDDDGVMYWLIYNVDEKLCFHSYDVGNEWWEQKWCWHLREMLKWYLSKESENGDEQAG